MASKYEALENAIREHIEAEKAFAEAKRVESVAWSTYILESGKLIDDGTGITGKDVFDTYEHIRREMG